MHGLAQIKEMNGPSRVRLTEERVNNIPEARNLARMEGIVSDDKVQPLFRTVKGTDGIRAVSTTAVQDKNSWHGEYQSRGDMGLWHKVRNNDHKPICYSTPEYALAAARLYRDEERVRYEAAFGQS